MPPAPWLCPWVPAGLGWISHLTPLGWKSGLEGQRWHQPPADSSLEPSPGFFILHPPQVVPSLPAGWTEAAPPDDSPGPEPGVPGSAGVDGSPAHRGRGENACHPGLQGHPEAQTAAAGGGTGEGPGPTQGPPLSPAWRSWASLVPTRVCRQSAGSTGPQDLRGDGCPHCCSSVDEPWGSPQPRTSARGTPRARCRSRDHCSATNLLVVKLPLSANGVSASMPPRPVRIPSCVAAGKGTRLCRCVRGCTGWCAGRRAGRWQSWPAAGLLSLSLAAGWPWQGSGCGQDPCCSGSGETPVPSHDISGSHPGSWLEESEPSPGDVEHPAVRRTHLHCVTPPLSLLRDAT